MQAANMLRFSVEDFVNGVEVGPAHVPLLLLGEFQRDVLEFLKGSGRDIDPAQLQVSIETGSLAFVVSGVLSARALWTDLATLELPDALDLIDIKRTAVLARWQASARIHPQRRYLVQDGGGRAFVAIDAQSKFIKTDDVWVQVEKYLHGKIVDMGGKAKANVHLELENGQMLTVSASHDLLAQDEQNRLYRSALLHVIAEENLHSGELRNLRLLAFEPYQPAYGEDEFRRFVERGTRAWSDVPDTKEWLEKLRGGGA